MVGAIDLRVDFGLLDLFGKAGGYAEIVDAPSCVLLPRVEPVRPPGISAGSVRIQIAEGINEACIQQFAEFAAFLIRKTGLSTIGLRVFQVNLLMRHI